jgi:hypothetical protein
MLNLQMLCVDLSIWENNKKLCFYFLNLCVNHSVLSFFSFLCDNLLLQKCVQSLCKITVHFFVCQSHRPKGRGHWRVGAGGGQLQEKEERLEQRWVMPLTLTTQPHQKLDF